MLFSTFLDVLWGESKVYKKYLWVRIQIPIGIDHDVLKLEIIIRSFWTMDIFENVDQIAHYDDGFLDFLYSFEFAQIVANVHLIERHNEKCY